MSTAFSQMTDSLFNDTNIAQDVTYKVGGNGAGVTVRGIFDRPQKDVGLGQLGASVQAHTLKVRIAEITTAAEGDTVVIGATNYRVVAPELDDNGLAWRMSLDFA